MARSTLAGSRIRARRLDLGLRQASLARRCGISPSYLNLIEHNRRAIGGKLLLGIARELEVEPAVLSEGAEAARIGALRAAAEALHESSAETERAEEFAGRFPGWAGVVEAQARRVATLERTVETLSDRLTHDPLLSEALHDVLSVVTAVRSTTAILAGDDPVDPEWQVRFLRNLHEDSRRLAEAAQALAKYLESDAGQENDPGSPQEELETWLASRGYHVAELEGPGAVAVEQIVDGAEALVTEAGRALAARFLLRYRKDAERLPMPHLRRIVADAGPDPAEVAQRGGTDLPTAIRRLAVLPAGELSVPLGLVLCDGSGTFTFRKPVEGFSLPRFGAACPLWPLYQALARPMTPLKVPVAVPGPPERQFLTYAVSQATYPGGFDGPPVIEAAMLIAPSRQATTEASNPLQVGTSCRICPRKGCAARREPSILGGG